MKRPVVGAACLVGLLLLLPPSSAEEDFLKQKANAIDKGSAWLKKSQGADGSWDYDNGPFAIMGGNGQPIHMKQGTTSLCAYALLKSGTAPDDPVINKAFDYIHGCQIEHVYSAGCVLLAIEARCNWEPPREDESAEAPSDNQTHEKKGKPAPKKRKPSPKDIDLAGRCVEFLHKTQQRNTWRYPMMDTEDASNAQYALLGLDAAERLGVAVPKEIYEKAQEYFVYNQEKDGPNVTPFPVPGADLSYKELKAIEKEMREKLKQIDGQFKGKKPGDTNEAGHTEEDERRTTEEEASRKVLKTVSGGQKMKARGWAYAYPPIEKGGAGDGTQGGNRAGGGGSAAHQPLEHWKTIPTGSMTASGLACLFICKAHLDGTAVYQKQLKGPIDKALRDGAAWLAEHFSVSHNPTGTDSGEGGGGAGGGGGGRGGRGGRGGGGGGAGGERAGHHYYYMYGLERAGILGLIPKFGEHDWYDDGCHMFVKAQKGDGSWDAGGAEGTVGPTCDTCFALLFLARGTTPVVRIPTRTATGPAQPQAQPQPQGGGKGEAPKGGDAPKGGEGEGKGKGDGDGD